MIYGVAGVGKTTLAAAAPSPVFLLGEDGAGFLDVPAFPRPTAWYDTLEAVQELIESDHPYHSLVIDTLDGLEPLCTDAVCRSGGKKHIEEFGFGKGWLLAQDEWRKLLARLEHLQAKKRMHIILLAHAKTAEHKDPSHDVAWKRWTLKLHNKLAEATAEWTDALLFATHEAVAKKDGAKVRGYATGERLLYTTWAGSHDAKNRYNLPPVVSLSWDELWTASLPALRPAPTADLQALRDRLAELVPQLPDEQRTKAALAIEGTADPRRLQSILTHVQKLLTPVSI